MDPEGWFDIFNRSLEFGTLQNDRLRYRFRFDWYNDRVRKLFYNYWLKPVVLDMVLHIFILNTNDKLIFDCIN